jgi:hypothetical protein
MSDGTGDCQCARHRSTEAGRSGSGQPRSRPPSIPSPFLYVEGAVGPGGILLDSAAGTLPSLAAPVNPNSILEQNRHFARLVSGAETETGTFPPSYRKLNGNALSLEYLGHFLTSVVVHLTETAVTQDEWDLPRGRRPTRS